MAGKRKAIDWEAIESDYRAGQLSIRKVASRHGLTEGAIRKKAKTQGWLRDLTDKVKQATKEKLVRSEGTQDDARTNDEDIIDDASNNAVSLVLSHRSSIREYRTISNRLATKLKSIEIDENNHQAISRSLNSGIDALAKAIRLERQAFNIDDDQNGSYEDDLESLADGL